MNQIKLFLSVPFYFKISCHPFCTLHSLLFTCLEVYHTFAMGAGAVRMRSRDAVVPPLGRHERHKKFVSVIGDD